MSSIERIVIVGAGMAGGRAAESLRKHRFQGMITLVGSERDRPYSRPPLSKGYLRGEKDRASVYLHPESFYIDNWIDFQPSRTAVRLDPAAREVVMSDDGRLPFDRLLLATGARPRQLPVPGGDLPGVLTLRTLADADAIRARLDEAGQIVVIGGGWIACEVAASLRALGRDVTLVAPRRVLLGSVVGREIGAVIRDLHAEHGVDLRLGTKAIRLLGTDRVEGVELESGDRIPADLVVVGIGIEPAVELAADAGLAIDDGVEVSATLETSAPGIYAAGDVAAAWNPFYERRMRIEHVSNARLQGQAVAANLLGAAEPFDQIPSFFSEQHGVGLRYTGYASPSDRLVIRGSLADRRFIGFRLVDGRVAAAITVGEPETPVDVDRLIRSRAILDSALLADPSSPLEVPA